MERQFELFHLEPKNLLNNSLSQSDRAFHDWYRFVLSFPPHLVRYFFERLDIPEGGTVLDPFCGTGTTVVEAKKNGYSAFGIEANPMAAFASSVKSTWNVSLGTIHRDFDTLQNSLLTENEGNNQDFLRLTESQEKLLLANSISPSPLHKCLRIKQCIELLDHHESRNLLLLALATVAVHEASNLRFGPEVGVSRKRKLSAPVFEAFIDRVNLFLRDLNLVKKQTHPESTVLLADARNSYTTFSPKSIDSVVTSPPYPNEKDYTRTTRLESVLLGFLNDKAELRSTKKNLLRSNTRNVYKADTDDTHILNGSNVDRLAREIERRRIALKKTSGFERQYHRVTRLYFGGMLRHLRELQPYLRDGAKLAYVVGDQASYLRVLIRTGELLAELAESIGYTVLDLELFRTRVSTTTGDQLREEALILEWKPKKNRGILVDKKKNRYDVLIERVFFENYNEKTGESVFERTDFAEIATDLGIQLPKNLGDVIYSYRYRKTLPSRITDLLETGEEWVIRSIGRGAYKFSRSSLGWIVPNPRLTYTKIPDATPEVISRYYLHDEQALLAIIRYNRLVDIFLGITCYSLQSHLRTTVPDMGQVETDEVYVGLDKRGAHYIVPVQAKGKSDQLGSVQIEQDIAICKHKFAEAVCRPIAAQFIEQDLIAMFEFEEIDTEIRIKEEKHYRIVENSKITSDEVAQYNATGKQSE